MNCEQARELLPAVVYGDAPPELHAEVGHHLVTCPSCREEQAALAEVRRLLDFAPVPRVDVNMPRMFAEATRRQLKQVRRWRRAAMALGGAAAALLVVLTLNLEVRWQGRQVVLGRGLARTAEDSLEPRPGAVERPLPARPSGEVSAADMKLVKDLLHALAATVEERDGKFEQDLALVQLRLNQMQELARSRWATTESYVSALHAVQSESRMKGEKQ
jgi:anti-sigma factor RsiW